MVWAILKLPEESRKEKIISFLKVQQDKGSRESIVRDVLEAQLLNHDQEYLNLLDIGMKVINGSFMFNKLLLAEQYPQFKSVLENPDTVIPQLIENDDAALLGALLDIVEDAEINTIFAKSVANQPLTKTILDLIQSRIENGSSRMRQLFAKFTFSNPHTKSMGHLVRLLIEKSVQSDDTDTLTLLAWKTFSEPHTKDMTDLIRLLIENGAEMEATTSLAYLAKHTFSQPHTRNMTDLIRLLIEKAAEFKYEQILRNLATYTFSQPHTKEMTSLIRLVIEKATEMKDNRTLDELREFTFSQPHTKDMVVLKEAVEIKDPVQRLAFLAEKLDSKQLPLQCTEAFKK